MSHASADTSKIDDVIAYIESPEYLHMIAEQQGENPNALLSDRPEITADPYRTPASLHPLSSQWVTTPPVRRPSGPNSTVRRSANTWQLTTRSSWREYRDCLRLRRPFKTYGALSGTTGNTPCSQRMGQLPEPIKSYLEIAHDASHVHYVIFSYATPLAWLEYNPITDAVEWIIPKINYSVTTTRHQGKITTALCESGDFVTFMSESGASTRNN